MSKAHAPDRHIGMLVHSFYPGDQRVRREAEALADAGYRVEVICLRAHFDSDGRKQPRWEMINGVFVHRLSILQKRGSAFRYLFEYTAVIVLGFWKLMSLHLGRRFQVVHIHNMPDILVLAGLPLKWMGAKLVLDVHDPMPEIYLSLNPSRHRSWTYRVLAAQEKWSCRWATRVIASNEVLAENLMKKGVPPAKIITINNFPDPRHFPPQSELSSWPKNKDRLTLIYAGTITNHYQLEDAIRALFLLKDKIPGICFLIVGSGNDKDRILRLASDLGLKNQVVHRNRVDQKTLRELINSADLGVSSHVGGPFGDLVFTQKILDYLSQGLPVVANRALTNLKYIPEEAIFYYESGRPEELAEQIIRIWNSPMIVQQKREYAVQLIGSFSWLKEKQRLVTCYQELTAFGVQRTS